MRFMDLNDNTVYSLADLRRDWETLRADDHVSYPESFRIELLEILMATINGRNDLEILGLTPRETRRYIRRLRETL